MTSTPDPERYLDFAYRADALLKSMNTNFWDVYGEWEREQQSYVSPKDGGGEADESFAPYSSASVADDDQSKLTVHLRVNEQTADSMLEDFVRFKTMGDRAAMAALLSMAEQVVRLVVRGGVRKGWYKQDIPEEGF